MVKLFKVTGNQKYLKLADWLLSERGYRNAKGYTWTDWKDTAYAQDAVPVKDQKEITGHAVRAMYLYTGAADVATQTGDTGYLKAMRRVWEDVVYRNMYITGGIGSAGSNEGFSKDFDLPNEQAYCETCASVGMVFWNQRMNALTMNSSYIDILERSLYNGALDGLSLSGDRFFYGNPLASKGQHQRKEWFGTACCPSNIARLVASLGNYIYATTEKSIYINLFVGSSTKLSLANGSVNVKMATNYPWDGKINLHIDPLNKSFFGLFLRIPGWVQGKTYTNGLYDYSNFKTNDYTVKVNGKGVTTRVESGYLVIERDWEKGDQVTYDLPMQVNRLVSATDLKFNNNRVAIQRGPIVYCVEGADNNNKAWNFILPATADFEISDQTILDEPIKALSAIVPVMTVSADGSSLQTEKKKITAIPYYTWANRGKNEMQVWLPTTIKNIKIND